MSNRINNKYEYRSGLLDSLNVQHTASDVRNEDEYRKKVLNGLGVEYTDDDINQKSLYRAKVVEGLASSGGGGSSDFSTANVTLGGSSHLGFPITLLVNGEVSAITIRNVDFGGKLGEKTFTVPLYKGMYVLQLDEGETATIVGNAEYNEEFKRVFITGDCTITIS